jgi:hypothetical protein
VVAAEEIRPTGSERAGRMQQMLDGPASIPMGIYSCSMACTVPLRRALAATVRDP